ncbi:c-type cytochrome biogenesis protein CcmI [Phenylobacterium sp.]|jgi:cytochrome c-type biogenesis protein CcmH|uniref:c-type cytochrome biogenesis protein CcmI n=1 Tax=Phenylobacterium sp. TaxID=1871053 RepID=UPI002F3E8BA5
MIVFWVAAGLLSAAAAILMMLRAARAAEAEPADTTQVFYRRQLSEIGDLAARGLIGADERRSAEAEAGRRLLAAADAPGEAWSTEAHRLPILLVALAASILALVLYVKVGAPGFPDQPFAGRLAKWRASDPRSLDPPQMAAVLSQLTKERPNDPEGFRFLALAQGASNNPAAAVRALKHAVRVAPDRADLWEMLGEADVMIAGGEVSDDAVDAFRQTLRLNPSSVAARFNLARYKIKVGDKAQGIAEWKALLADMPATDPRRGDLGAAIAQAEGTAPPPAAAGAPPQGLSADQLTAVRGMVEGLAAKLKANPDDPEGWVRLVRAYAVLGDEAKRDETLKTARAKYAGKPDVLDQLTQAAATEKMK